MYKNTIVLDIMERNLLICQQKIMLVDENKPSCCILCGFNQVNIYKRKSSFQISGHSFPGESAHVSTLVDYIETKCFVNEISLFEIRRRMGYLIKDIPP